MPPGRHVHSLRTRLIAAFLFATSAVIALTLGDFRKVPWPKGIVESAWLVLLVFVLVAIPADGPSLALGACLFVGAWVLTQKLDNEQIGNRLQHELRVI